VTVWERAFLTVGLFFPTGSLFCLRSLSRQQREGSSRK
jgi:hypothetical protein